MRAAALRRQPDGWDIPTIEDDAETQVFFQPDPETDLVPPLDAMPLVRMSLPIDVAPVVPVMRIAPPPPPPPPAPVYVPQPQPVYFAPRPQPKPIPMTYARSRPMPPIEAQHTARVRRPPLDSRRTVVITLTGACVVAAMMIVAAVAVRGSHAQHASASVVTAPAPAAVVAPVVAPAPAPAPAREIVMTATPIEAPPADHRNVVIVSEEPALVPPPQPVQAVEPAPRAHRSHHVTPAPVAVAVTHTAPVAVTHAAPVAVAAAPTGTLELSTKPPCEIVIDGKATGFTTPRKGIAIAAGRHQVTLTNADEGIQLTTEVTVTAGHATRMIRDFTK